MMKIIEEIVSWLFWLIFLKGISTLICIQFGPHSSNHFPIFPVVKISKIQVDILSVAKIGFLIIWKVPIQTWIMNLLKSVTVMTIFWLACFMQTNREVPCFPYFCGWYSVRVIIATSTIAILELLFHLLINASKLEGQQFKTMFRKWLAQKICFYEQDNGIH